jgi:hypothetical protein
MVPTVTEGVYMTFTSKIGAARQVPGSRVWLEGTRLVAAGFTVGVRYNLTEADGQLILTLAADGGRKVSGKGDKPIIDITGDLIRRVFAGRLTVTVEYTDRIVLS